MSGLNKCQNLTDFLKKHKKKDSTEFTHTIIGDPKNGIYSGSFTVPDDKTDEFLKLYYEFVFKDGNNAYLTERHLDKGPIVIDLDFRFAGKLESRAYTPDFITKFLTIYNKELSNIISPSISKIQAFVMEKKTPVYKEEKNFTKDGLHIIYPYLIIPPKIQYAARYKTIMNPEFKDLIKSIGIINSADDVFDKCVIEKNNWQMYGSQKPNCEPYQFQDVYDSNSMITKETKFKHKELLRLLTVRNFNPKYDYELSEEENGKIEEIISKLPNKHKDTKPMKLKKMKSPTNKKFTDAEELKMAKELVDILSKVRADDYTDWLQVGFCLHNIDFRLLETWIKFSQQSDKFEENKCETEWNYMNNDGLGMGSLCRWAKYDNPVRYNKIMSTNRNKILIDSLSGTHTDIARVVYDMYKYEFVCASISKKVWFQFKDHRWRRLDDAVALRLYISNDVVNEYLRMHSDINKQAMEFDSSSTSKEILIERGNKIMKVINSLKKTSFKKSIVEECSEIFYMDKFEDKLDSNLDLVCFENGVYDLEHGKFRAGLSEDFVSFTTGIYYQEFSEDDSEYNDVKTFMSQILPIKKVCEYVMRLLSSFLSGKVKDQKFHIWTGCGGNGKSKLIELFRMGFGEYCCTLPVSLITQKRGRAEGATPALASTKGKRFACLQEPEGDETINVGLMKELTGSDPIMARKLHTDPVEFRPQFKMVLTCNILPEIKSDDRGTWRRVRAVEFLSIFTDEPDPNDPFQFKIDEELDAKMDLWKEVFMFILLEEFKIYKKHGVKEPNEVMKFTKEYQNESDNFTQFMEECISETESNGEGLSSKDIYVVYQDWFIKNKGVKVPIPKKKALEDKLKKKYGVCKGNKWYGITLNNTIFAEDEIADI